MKISTRLHLNTALIIALIVVLCGLLAWSYKETARLDANARLAAELHKTAFARIILRGDYLLTVTPQAAARFEAKTKAMGELLDKAAAHLTDPEEIGLLETARDNFKATRFVVEPPQRPGVLSSQERKAMDQLFAKAHNLNESIAHLHHHAHEASQRAWNKTFIIILLCIIGGGLLIVFNSFQTQRTITARLQALHEGLTLYGRGELDYRLTIPGYDELAALPIMATAWRPRLRNPIRRWRT
ncbi:MAG: hypothetical protein N2Z74_08490 [Syntrophales bacterium]|nr:hypothetical protein [Syntrophales bacterium]